MGPVTQQPATSQQPLMSGWPALKSGAAHAQLLRPPTTQVSAAALSAMNGMSSLPGIHIVTPTIKHDILNGKDVNLPVLLFPIKKRHYAHSGQREVKIRDEVIALKPGTDSSLTKSLREEVVMLGVCIIYSNACICKIEMGLKARG